MTPINVFITRDIPGIVKRMDACTDKQWHLHVDTNLDKSFLCLKIANLHHESVWLFLTSTEISSLSLHGMGSMQSYYGEQFEMLFMGFAKLHKDQIWKKISILAKKWNARNQSPYRIFEEILSGIVEVVGCKDQVAAILNAAYNKSFRTGSHDPGSGMDENLDVNDFEVSVLGIRAKADLKDLHYLSGYEREMRYYHEGSWDFMIDETTNMQFKNCLLAHLSSKTEPQTPEELLPVGYIAALDGDKRRRHGVKSIESGCITVISFAVDPRARRKKIGTLLFQRLFLESSKPIKVVVELENFESALFLKSLGFDPPKLTPDGDYLIFKEKNPERLLV